MTFIVYNNDKRENFTVKSTIASVTTAVCHSHKIVWCCHRFAIQRCLIDLKTALCTNLKCLLLLFLIMLVSDFRSA